MRRSVATVVSATLIGTSLSACAAAPDPTPVIYWAEAKLHVIVKAIEPVENGGSRPGCAVKALTAQAPRPGQDRALG
jgi:hypothetical protein